jgi:uncharacterized protein (TIGR00730 family)
MSNPIRVVTVFGSSRPCEGEPDYAEARELGWALAAKGFVVCTGGYGGVMEAALRGAKDAGGNTLAATAEFFSARANRWVDEEIRFKTWEQRLFELIRRGHAYVACKGGTGTLAELAVVWEMLKRSVMQRKPFVVLGEFWRPILERIQEAEAGPSSERPEAQRPLIYIASTPERAAEYLAQQLARCE